MSYRHIVMACLVGMNVPIIGANQTTENVNANNTQQLSEEQVKYLNQLATAVDIFKGCAKGFLTDRVSTVASNLALLAPGIHKSQNTNPIRTSVLAHASGMGSTYAMDKLCYPAHGTSTQQTAYIATRIGLFFMNYFTDWATPPPFLGAYNSKCSINGYKNGMAIATASFCATTIPQKKLVELDGNQLHIAGIDCSHWLNTKQ